MRFHSKWSSMVMYCHKACPVPNYFKFDSFFFFYSGYADRIHELLAISRELSVANSKSSGTRNCFSQADYIEFAGVKVCIIY